MSIHRTLRVVVLLPLILLGTVLPLDRSTGLTWANQAPLLAPITHATLSPRPLHTGWNTSPVTVSLQAMARTPHAQVTQITYSLSGPQPSGPVVTPGNAVAFTVTPPGETTVTYFAEDSTGTVGAPEVLVVRIDPASPVLTALAVDPPILWPPDGRLVEVAVTYTVTDVSPTSCALEVASSDRAGPARPRAPDWRFVDAHRVQLRAELAEGTLERTYTLAVTCTDEVGLSSTAQTGVAVRFDYAWELAHCADTDGDGFCDTWEDQNYIDLNGNGVYDEGTDISLTDADPNKPDVYVQYDWMGWGPPGNKCTVAADCTNMGSGHSGETCVSGWCVYSCAVDSDCQTRGPAPTTPGHAKDKCMSFIGTGTKVCQHTHDPEYLAPTVLQEVVDSFAGHDINIHIIRGHEQPHSLVTSFRRDSEMTETCEGGSLYLGNVGVGKYAVSLYDLKAMSALDKQNIAYHYGFFGHYSSCDSDAHCSACPAALNPDGSPKAQPVLKQTGIAEISGNDFIVSLGGLLGDLAKAPGPYNVGSVFMHELGHNLGLHHGGGIDTPCGTDADCPGGAPGSCSVTPVGKYCLLSNDDNYKPNYLSIMNYRYTLTGILPSPGAGATTPITCQSDADCPAGNRCNLTAQPGHCARLDFSMEILPTGGNMPGALDEVFDGIRPGLDESAGLGSNRPPDLFSFMDTGNCIGGGPPSYVSTIGPVDWDGDGAYDNSHVSGEIHYFAGIGHACGTDLKLLTGYVDWGPAAPTNFTYQFQRTPYAGPLGDGPPPISSRRLTTCISPEEAEENHVLYPPREVKMSLETEDGMSQKQVRVVIHGDKDLDVAEIEQSSLKFAGAAPVHVETKAGDNDNRMDLVLHFDSASLKPGKNAKKAHLSGWLKNSQVITGTADISGHP